MFSFTVKSDFDLYKSLGRIVREISEDLEKEIKSRTPVDTGNAKRGWKQKHSRNRSTVSNKVKYIQALEDGHSKQAPKGFVNQSVKKIQRNARSGKYKTRNNK